MNFHRLRRPSANGRKRLTLAALLLAVVVVAIALSGLIGRDASERGNSTLQVPAAAGGVDLPEDATATSTASPMSTHTSTTEPDVTDTPISMITSVVRPTRTRAATGTRVPTAVFTMIAATHIAHATNVAAARQEIRTSVALTHAPTITPGRRPSYPSPTPIMGMLPGCGNISSDGPQAYSCWRGVVDGQLVEVFSGREGTDGDRTQGLIWVRVRDQGQQANIYETPNRVGAVRIASVSGTLFTLETVDQPTPQEFVFDLDTRQWVSP